MMDIYPVTHQAQVNQMKIGQFGLFLTDLGTLFVGVITESGLKGRVIHSGLTQAMCDDGLYHSGGPFREGYTYDRWSMHECEYVGRLRTYESFDGYMEFLDAATYDQIKAYFKTKELLNDNKLRK
jgi:hypothetical protein